MSRPHYYRLDEQHRPVPLDVYPSAAFSAWWADMSNRRVASTEIGDVHVSTVFLGIDHQFGQGEPILFETMVFGGAFDDEQERYHTWEEAVAGHARWCGRVQADRWGQGEEGSDG